MPRLTTLTTLPILALLLLFPSPALSLPQTYPISGTFTGAIYVTPATNPNLSAAVPAQCPSDHPTSCTALGQPAYCCPSSNYCAYTTNDVVGCCPIGQTCTGSIGGAGGYSPTSWYQSTTYYQPPTTTYYQQTPTTVYEQPTPAATTVYAGGGAIVPAGYVTTQYVQQSTAQQQTVYNGNGAYCSTLIAIGPGLPTTAAGQCGTILVESAAPAVAVSAGARGMMGWGWAEMIGLVVVLQGVGIMVFATRL